MAFTHRIYNKNPFTVVLKFVCFLYDIRTVVFFYTLYIPIMI
jgi:hypothetical protein